LKHKQRCGSAAVFAASNALAGCRNASRQIPLTFLRGVKCTNFIASSSQQEITGKDLTSKGISASDSDHELFTFVLYPEADGTNQGCGWHAAVRQGGLGDVVTALGRM
jgi:hypothetical protein